MTRTSRSGGWSASPTLFEQTQSLFLHRTRQKTGGLTQPLAVFGISDVDCRVTASGGTSEDRSLLNIAHATMHQLLAVSSDANCNHGIPRNDRRKACRKALSLMVTTRLYQASIRRFFLTNPVNKCHSVPSGKSTLPRATWCMPAWPCPRTPHSQVAAPWQWPMGHCLA